MSVLYKIRDWDKHFERAQSRKVDGALSWVALPCKHDGKGFRRIMAMDDGCAIYGAWVLLVQVAAKCPVRGVLADDDGPLDVTDIALKTGCRESHLIAALKVLCGSKIGWIEVCGVGAEWEQSGIACPLEKSREEEIREDQKREEEIRNSSSAIAEGEPSGSDAPGASQTRSDSPGSTAPGLSRANGSPAKTKVAYTAAFLQWYATYPRKIGKEDAASAFGRTIRKLAASRGISNADALEWLCSVTRAFANSPAGQAGVFCPHPATWLNRGSYDDDQAEWQRNDGKSDPRGNASAAEEFLREMEGKSGKL